MNLAARGRPKLFDEVVGQDEAVDQLRSAVRGQRGSVLLVGPSGCGKSSLAQLYAASLLCEAFSGDERCGACESCKVFTLGGHPNLREVDFGESRDEAVAREINQDVATESLSGGWQVFILDHIDRAHSGALDILRGRFERTPPRVAFIACAETLSALPTWLRECPDEINVDYVETAAAKVALERIARAETIAVDDDALWLIAESSGGSVRAAVRDLGALAARGPVTTERARARYGVPAALAICSYLDALVSGDLEAQYASIASWPGTARTRNHTLTDILWQTYACLQPAKQIASSKSLQPIQFFSYAFRLTSRARKHDVANKIFWSQVLRDDEDVTTETQLFRRVCRLHNFVLVESEELKERPQNLPVPPPRFKSDRSSPQSYRRGTSGGPYLSGSQARKILDAASFMGQEYGVLFNTRISISYGALGIDDLREAMAFLGALTHELGQIVSNRVQGASLHWAYVHENNNDGHRTHIAAAIPLAPLVVRQWLEGFTQNRGSTASALVCRVSGGTRRSIVRKHRFLLRLLCRTLDPSLEASGRMGRPEPFLDVLDIPNRLRREVAAVGLPQRFRVSKTIGEGAQRRAQDIGLPLISACEAGAFHAVSEGWELDEHPARLSQRKSREKSLADLRRSDPPEAGETSKTRYLKKLGDMEKCWRREHQERLKMWLGLWLEM